MNRFIQLKLDKRRQALEEKDGPLRELTGLLDFSHGRVQPRRGVQPDDPEESGRNSDSGSFFIVGEVRKTHECGLLQVGVLIERPIENASDFVLLIRCGYGIQQAPRHAFESSHTLEEGLDGGAEFRLPLASDEPPADAHEGDHVECVGRGPRAGGNLESRRDLGKLPLENFLFQCKAGLLVHCGERVALEHQDSARDDLLAIRVAKAHDLELEFLDFRFGLLGAGLFAGRLSGKALDGSASGQRKNEDRQHSPTQCRSPAGQCETRAVAE